MEAPFNLLESEYFKFEQGVTTTGNWRPCNENAFQLLKKKLGRSTTAEVNLLAHKKSGFLGVMKVVKSDRQREIKAETGTLLVARDCPFLLHLVDGFKTEAKEPATSYSICMLLEYATFKTLDDLTIAVKGIGPAKTRFYAMEIASGLVYLHRQNIMHRDVKPGNMFIRASGHVALGDFGQSMPATPGSRTTCATRATRPPEVWSHENYSLPADIWMFGASIYFIIACSWPFLSINKEKQLQLITAGVFDSRKLSADSTDLLARIFKADPDIRPRASQILEHPYITSLQQPSAPPFTPAELFQALSTTYSEEERQLLHLLIPAPQS
ncbi:hypothetical protein BsWGS_13071 [Bradybaena similaris]